MPADDSAIWEWAKRNEYILIVTNDEDFKHLVERLGFPPKIVLLRTGNQSTQFVARVLEQHRADLHELFASDEVGILEVF